MLLWIIFAIYTAFVVWVVWFGGAEAMEGSFLEAFTSNDRWLGGLVSNSFLFKACLFVGWLLQLAILLGIQIPGKRWILKFL